MASEEELEEKDSDIFVGGGALTGKRLWFVVNFSSLLHIEANGELFFCPPDFLARLADDGADE